MGQRGSCPNTRPPVRAESWPQVGKGANHPRGSSKTQAGLPPFPPYFLAGENHIFISKVSSQMMI